ncbi:MAG: hypothetical protein F6K36_24800 [Symploca sp. SIO3C6]|uniref:Uncharacterized protein n=1 Tax=Symploca sp. SIO1C4 TaxID=2607765 RepID=A0A6B3NBU7_9CYAN|nr:hypothetical protein [Symploca sp. SIO3C6]NER28395.1 hypothetical protein [Symploca sp. SIO1C4]NET04734.1 hypothetical protein [Symploca sp. SIO2B6]
MYNSSVVNLDAKSQGVDSVWHLVQDLSADDKAELVERLLGKESGMLLTSASSNLADYIIAQASLLSLEGLAYVCREIEEQIVTEANNYLRYSVSPIDEA